MFIILTIQLIKELKTEGLLYAPGITDQCKYEFLVRKLK